MSKRPVRRWIARTFLALTGWTADGVRPEPKHAVLIAAPHTTNWDFPYLLAFAELFELKINWMGKHSLFRPPFGFVMRALGGVPIVRHKRQNMVDAMAGSFEGHEELILVVPVEGTRSRAEHWKSGFYHIACKANVPIVLSYLDYAKKVGGFGPTLTPSGDLGKDMDQIRAFYSGKSGKFPEEFGPIRLREEDAIPSGLKSTKIGEDQARS